MLNNRSPISGTATFEENVLSEEIVIEKYVKTFLDMVILAMLNGKATYGYKIISGIHTEFGILLSPASLYPLLHLLENNKLIESNFDRGKTVYCLTPKGKETLGRKFTAYNLSNQIMRNFIKTHAKI
jgi:DNA-binding PadR family transcriptional regulator